MGIFDALTTAVGGLQAQSYALQNISGNIANSETTAYKETDTSFADLVSAAASGKQIAGGVIASSVATNTVQGTIQSASVSTDMAINGDGWFVVQNPTSYSDNQPVFSGVDDYTRRGDFQLNQNGNLVNGAGYYLMGIPVDPTTGNPTGSVPQVLQFTNNFMAAQATTTIQYQANLPSSPATTDANSSIPGSELLNPADFESNPLIGGQTAAQITGTTAQLAPDADATGTGTVALTSGTDLSTLGFGTGTPPETITVSDGTNTTTYTYAAGDSVQTMLQALSAGPAAVKATLDPTTGDLVLTGTNPDDTLTIGGTAADVAAIGFGTGSTSFSPTNLITQNAVQAGQSLTFTLTDPTTNISTTQTITFGNGTGQVASMADLQNQLNALTGITGTVNTANGNITLTATGNSSNDILSVSGSPSSLAGKFGVTNLTAYPGNGTVIANDVTTFTNQSIAGGSITTYDATGNAVNVEFRWAQVTSTANGGSSNTWQLFYQTSSNATGTQSAWTNVGQTFTFDSTGQLSPPISTLTIPNLTVNGDSVGSVQLQFGSGGLTQYADTSGTSQINNLQQNGFAAGKLQSVAVDSENRVTGTFSNGQTIPLADITLATFNGQDGLQALSGGAYAATAESGAPIYSATGTIEGSSLEASNVDIATQFSQLIVAQQAYSANSRVMTVADQMIQSLLTVIQ